MQIGIDFDNTIVCYDELFHDEAVRRGLIPERVEHSKNRVRDYLRSAGKEDAWTELQGYVYGPGIQQAQPFPGVRQFLSTLHQRDVCVCIISHKTRFPVLGPKYDLHEAARSWLVAQQLLGPKPFGLSEEQLYFEETKEGKLARIATTGCTHFIDDLPEFLLEPEFPPAVVRILFDPHRCCLSAESMQTVHSWNDVISILP